MQQTDARSRATAIVAGLSSGGGFEHGGAEELLPLVYDELRHLARHYMAGERPGHTLQPTVLVHEAFLRLVDRPMADWRGRTHFLAVGARVMRRLLIDHARGRGRQKRGGGLCRVTLTDWRQPSGDGDLDPPELLDLDAALERLARVDGRAARVVELRFFGGLTVAETAEALGVSKRTVEQDWTHARAWLRRELSTRDGR